MAFFLKNQNNGFVTVKVGDYSETVNPGMSIGPFDTSTLDIDEKVVRGILTRIEVEDPGPVETIVETSFYVSDDANSHQDNQDAEAIGEDDE